MKRNKSEMRRTNLLWKLREAGVPKWIGAYIQESFPLGQQEKIMRKVLAEIEDGADLVFNVEVTDDEGYRMFSTFVND